MKNLLVIVLLLAATGCSNKVYSVFGLNAPPVFPNGKDLSPQFTGGQDSLWRFIKRNFNYPDNAKQSKIEGGVMVSFIVDKTGNIKSIGIFGKGLFEKPLSDECYDEAIRLVKSMPKWSPGKLNGHKINVRDFVYVPFKLNSN